MAYATIDEIVAGFKESEDERKMQALIEEASVIIDAYNKEVSPEVKKVVTIRMVRRALGSESAVPVGATQGSVSALGYSQSWTISNGASGELYLGKTEKKLLGIGNRIGSKSPLEDIA